MLSISDGDQGITRRRLLTIGSLGLGGLSLPTLYAAGGPGSSEGNPVTGRSVIFLFQQGGPSQFETFDPKPDIPTGNRTIGGVIPTTIPGVIFGATLRRLAKLAHKLTVVRSFHSTAARASAGSSRSGSLRAKMPPAGTRTRWR